MYSADMRMVGGRKGVVGKCLPLLLLSDILFVLIPVTLRIVILLLSVIIVKRDFTCFRRGLGGRLDGRLVLLTFASSFGTFLLRLALGSALGLAIDEGRDGVDVGVERLFYDCFDVVSDLLFEGLVQEESECPSAPHRRHFPVVRGCL